MHSFTVSFRVRSTTTGTVASVMLPDSSVYPTVEITATGLAYRGTNGVLNNSGVSGTNGAWHDIVVAHQYARGLTWFYVDGVLANTVSERLTPVGFVLGGPGSAATSSGSPAQADYQNWFVYRSMLNVEEVKAQYQGNLQQASLELYVPLDDNTFAQGAAVTNRAQSYSVGLINGASDNYQSVDAMPSPTNLIVSSNYTPAMILSWTDPAAITEDAYYVERNTAGGVWTTIAILAAHATSYTDLAVSLGINYQYRVSYSQSALRSDYSLSAIVQLPPTNGFSASIPVLIDFGPNNGLDGNITASPDVNGNYWNNLMATANGYVITNLVTTNNQSSTIAITLTSGGWLENGIRSGGLTNPSAGLLRIFAIPAATEDFFYVSGTYGTTNGTQTFLISGLNPATNYNLSMFGTRNSAGIAPYTRTTTYSVTDVNGTHSVNLVTSGTNVNSGTNPQDTSGNDKTIASLNGLAPNAAGQLAFSVSAGDTANIAYLAAMLISPGPPPGPTVSAHPDVLINFTMSGQPVANPDVFGHYWNNLSSLTTSVGLTNLITTNNTTTTIALANLNVSGLGNNSVGPTSVDTNRLGYFSVLNACSTFYYSSGSNAFAISGLTTGNNYNLRWYGARDATDARISHYTLFCGNGTFTTNVQTTGANVGGTGTNYTYTIPRLVWLTPTNNQIIFSVATNLGSTLAYLNLMEITVNRPPVAGTVTTNRSTGVPLTISTAFLLAQASDPDGDPVNFDNFSALPAGATTNATSITLPGTNTVQTFNYTVDDGNGLTNSGTVTITIAMVSPPVFNAPQIFSGNLILTGIGGTPGAGYTWLTSTNVTIPVTNWTVSVTGTLDGTGSCSNAIPVNAFQTGNFFRLRMP